MSSLTLKQFKYFDALARLGHFGNAAAVCSISQPALSMQIKEMEQTLGTALFERSARHVRLTAFGEEIRTRVREILSLVDQLDDLVRASEDQLVGRLRMGVIPTVAPYLLPSIIGALDKTHSGLDIHVRETVTPKLVEELVDGRLDAAIVALPLSEPSLTELPLFEENFVLVRPIGETDQSPPSADTLRGMRLLLLEEGHCFRDQALAFCNIQSAIPRDGLDGSSLSTLVQLAGAGLGVTLIPEMAVGVETGSAPVSVTRFKHPQPSRTIGMIWRKSSPLTDKLIQISEVIRRAATSPTGNDQSV